MLADGLAVADLTTVYPKRGRERERRGWNEEVRREEWMMEGKWYGQIREETERRGQDWMNEWIVSLIYLGVIIDLSLPLQTMRRRRKRKKSMKCATRMWHWRWFSRGLINIRSKKRKEILSKYVLMEIWRFSLRLLFLSSSLPPFFLLSALDSFLWQGTSSTNRDVSFYSLFDFFPNWIPFIWFSFISFIHWLSSSIVLLPSSSLFLWSRKEDLTSICSPTLSNQPAQKQPVPFLHSLFLSLSLPSLSS